MLGHDLGTALVLMALVAGVLFVAGRAAAGCSPGGWARLRSSARYFVLSSRAPAGPGAAVPRPVADADDRTACQATHRQCALAAGGWWGVGLGASREKWGRLPEAHNDFIFAIIGEELGLPGTLVVLPCSPRSALRASGSRARTDDLFVRIATAGIMAWCSGRRWSTSVAVLGLLPVVGVPLPLVSYGGSALVPTLVALGMLLSFARANPAARALATRGAPAARIARRAAAPQRPSSARGQDR